METLQFGASTDDGKDGSPWFQAHPDPPHYLLKQGLCGIKCLVGGDVTHPQQ